MRREKRAQQNAVDVGAFEVYFNHEDTSYIMCQELAGSLQLCNNLILNNGIDNLMNVSTLSASNIVGEDTLVFTDNHLDFSIKPGSVAVNAGDNDCVIWGRDLRREKRVQQNTVDVGAFELYSAREAFIVFQEDAGLLSLCNNLILNNEIIPVTNVPVLSENNITGEDTSIFVDNALDFSLQEGAVAVNAGDNACVSWELDISGYNRIVCHTVDIGAYEVVSIEPDATLIVATICTGESYYFNGVGDSLIINQLTNGQYRVTAYTEFLCTASDSIDIAIYPVPDYSIVVPPQTLCVGDTAQISISGQNNWLWSPMTGVIYHDNNRTLVQPEVTTDYVGRIVNQYGCIDSVSVHINVYPPLPLQLSPDTAICLGESLTLTVSGAWNYLWSNGQTSSSFTITPTENTNFSVSSIDEHGCVTTKHTEIQVKPDFNLNLMVTKDTICVGDSTTLWYYGSADQYTWSTGSTGTHTVEHPGCFVWRGWNSTFGNG